ncbi:protein MKS1-like [Carex rostrata]
MDGKQPHRRELQGPRPAPLKVRKDSHKVRKPPVAPPQQQPAAAPVIQHRPPVIIYAVSPKVIHTNPSEFMSLVQRLTGSSSSSSSSSAAASAPSLPAPASFLPASTASPFPYSNYLLPGFLSETAGNSGFSPAARYATIEQGRKETRIEAMTKAREDDLMLTQFGIDAGPRLDQIGLSPAGILSPVPSSLPVISRNLFSPLNNNDQAAGGLGFLHDLSPVFAANRSLTGNNYFATTPGSFFANTPTSNFLSMTTPPVVPSPGAYSWDLFQHYQDQ